MSFAYGQTGSIRGTVISDDDEPVPFAQVVVYSQDSASRQFIAGVATDFDGLFVLKNIEPGTYNVKITDESMLAYPVELTEVVVKAEKVSFLGEIGMSNREIIYCDFGLPDWRIEFLQQVPFGNATIIEKEDLRRP